MSANGAMTDDVENDGPDIEPEATDDGGSDRDSDREPQRRADGDGPKPPRRERRVNKIQEEREARERAEAEARDYRERHTRLEQTVSEMRGYLAAQAQRTQQDPNASIDKRIEALEDEADNHLERAAQYAVAKDTAGQRREMRAYNAKLREATVLAYEARSKPELEQRFQQMQQNMPDPALQSIHAQALQEFPWLSTDQDAEALANEKLRRLIQSGKPKTLATIREACTDTAKRLGIGGRQAPTQQQRQRFTGVPGGEGAGGGGGDAKGEPEYNRTNRALAAKAFPALEGKKQWRAFVKMVQDSESEE